MDLIIQHNRLSKAKYHIPLPSNPQQSPKAHLLTQNIYRKLTSPSTALHQIHPPTQSHSRPIYPAKVEMGSYGKITRMLTDGDEPEIYVTPDNNREGDQMHCLGDRDALRANDLGAKKDDRVTFDVAANGKLLTNVHLGGPHDTWVKLRQPRDTNGGGGSANGQSNGYTNGHTNSSGS